MRKIQILVSLAAITMLCSCGNKDAQTTVTEQKKPTVTIQTAESREVAQISTFTGTVEANITNNIAPQNSMRIDRIFVEVGDRVSKGQKLVTMDNTNLQQAKVQLDNNKIEFERVDELYKIGGISKSDWDARKLALDISTANYENLKENTTLLSPISGIVTVRNYDNGDMHSAGKPILVVEQIRPVKLMINISESMFTYIKKNMKVDVQTDVYGDQIFTGRISLIHPRIDATTRTFPVEVEVANLDSKILPGMFARVTVTYGLMNNIVVPDQAVIKQTGSGDHYVYTVVDGKIVFKKVALGRRMGAEYEILSGLNAGDGHNSVTNGQEVEVVTK